MVKPSSVEQFIEAVNASSALTRACQKALDGSKDAKRFVAVAAKNGFKFTERQARSYFRTQFQAPSSRALSAALLRPVIGAKDEPGSRNDQLKNTVLMLRQMTFKKTPTWTSFGFAGSSKKGH